MLGYFQRFKQTQMGVSEHGVYPNLWFVELETSDHSSSFTINPPVITINRCYKPVPNGWFMALSFCVFASRSGSQSPMGLTIKKKHKKSTILHQNLLVMLPFQAISGLSFIGFILGHSRQAALCRLEEISVAGEMFIISLSYDCCCI